ncbi:MAG: hypothetical protein A2204_07945 [Elusimicrobia bacterium RIFOXYA1_FULL_47_7]|nr:MAG: hypothetical protein A2204_07945 [Elusimicrobia bacterium RIFOXYA1_FULL_47_7]
MAIKILTSETINKIAAGEVIERPSNALKELVENSIDAGSKTIDITVEGAGKTLMRVRDDGTGMSREDLALSVTRHVTSKISGFDDIYNLSTMGFRGEALPSIAAVSNLTIQTQERGAANGWEIKLSGGKLIESKAWAGSPGTVVETANLFFNTPARAKFLKSDATERSRIISTVEELAASHHAISFKLTVDGKILLNAPSAKSGFERLVDVFGNDFTSSLTAVSASNPMISLSGFVTKTEHSLPTKNYQYLFVNKRPVNLGKNIGHALYEAFRENIPSGRPPGAVLFIEVNPAEIDANIHPTKREVKFSKERELHDFIYRAVKNALTAAPVSMGMPGNVPSDGIAARRSDFVSETALRYDEFNSAKLNQSDIFAVSSEAARVGADDNTASDTKVIGQFFNSFIAASIKGEFVIIDQHAAAERIRYERYISEFKDKKIAVQGLLMPQTLDFNPGAASLLKGILPDLRQTGWEIEEFGSNTFRISAVPSVLGNLRDIKDILGAIIESLSEERNIPSARKLELIIRSACRGSIKAGEHMSCEEMSRLISDLLKCQAPFTCPHGRPTVLKITLSELRKHFGRT